MRQNWPFQPFNTIYGENSRNGITRPKATRGSGYKMVNMGELFAYGRFWNPEMERVQLSDSEIERFSLKRGDLLFARQSLVLEGTGKCSIIMDVPEITCFESHLIRVRLDKSRVEPNFYYYYFQSNQGKANIQSLVMQVAAAGIRGSELAFLKIPVPPLPTQHKIASILSAYDDLVENNTRRIKILEEMAQTIYNEWFVKFRFPGYENVKMVDSELGMIPEGWEVKKLSEVIELAYGKALKKENRIEGQIPVYGSGGIVGYHNNSLVKGPGIIVGRKGNVGSVFWSDDDFYPIDTVFYVNSELSLYYIYYNLQTQNFINNDAAVPGLSRNQAYLLPLLVPSKEVLTHFENIESRFFEQKNNLIKANDNLRKTRDLLLPRLISGEVDVSVLDINVEEITA